MSTPLPRRRVLRTPSAEAAPDPRRQARGARRGVQLAKDRLALKRWLTRLKRAANSVTELQARIARLEAALAPD